MHKDNLLTALMGGVADSFSPPHLAILALLAVFFFLTRHQPRMTLKITTAFAVGYLLCGLALRLGLLSKFVLTDWYRLVVALVYILMGMVLVILGTMFAGVWYRRYRYGQEAAVFVACPAVVGGKLDIFCWFAGLIGCLFALAGFIWTTSDALLLLSNSAMLPGMLWFSIFCLLIYQMVFVSLMGIVYVVTLYFSTKNPDQIPARWRSLLMAVCAAIFMAFGVGFLVVFIKQLIS